eukprot:snap_masked-scaffold_2-processed-gene-25.37-mRNA-1 protein AED:1.00 eAED:1.00 QI:0/0/0/0/1/1/4/0/347
MTFEFNELDLTGEIFCAPKTEINSNGEEKITGIEITSPSVNISNKRLGKQPTGERTPRSFVSAMQALQSRTKLSAYCIEEIKQLRKENKNLKLQREKDRNALDLQVKDFQSQKTKLKDSLKSTTVLLKQSDQKAFDEIKRLKKEFKKSKKSLIKCKEEKEHFQKEISDLSNRLGKEEEKRVDVEVLLEEVNKKNKEQNHSNETLISKLSKELDLAKRHSEELISLNMHITESIKFEEIATTKIQNDTPKNYTEQEVERLKTLLRRQKQRCSRCYICSGVSRQTTRKRETRLQPLKKLQGEIIAETALMRKTYTEKLEKHKICKAKDMFTQIQKKIEQIKMLESFLDS